MESRITATPAGAIRFDASLAETPDADWFNPEAWRRRDAEVAVLGGGRGGAWSIDAGLARYALRHYRRGGAIRHLLQDRYLFRNADATRGFREFDLLAQLHDEGFPVPKPVAVRYQQDGSWYRADLLMQLIDNGRSLHQRLRAGDPVDWTAMGRAIAGLHRRGVWHADLNAHNALVDDARRVWIIDFDRAQIRRPAASWQRANIERLARSLRKLGHGALLPIAWPQLQRGYAESSS